MNKSFIIILFALCAILITGCANTNIGNSTTSNTKTNESTINSISENPLEFTGDVVTLPDNWIFEDSYLLNDQFAVIETSEFVSNPLNYNNIIHKVFARLNTSVTATLKVYDSNNKVIDEYSNSIILTAGKNNYFSFLYHNDLEDIAKFEVTYNIDKSELYCDRNAVNLIDYELDNGTLYLNVEQIKENFDPWTTFKILYYKNNEIVSAYSGMFGSLTNKLTSVGSQASILVRSFGINFDNIEFIYEPK